MATRDLRHAPPRAQPQPGAKAEFLVIGTQKGGTTALDKFLRSHPQLGLGSRKELHFFDRDANFRDAPDYAAYHRSFAFDDGTALHGEVTPSYLFWPPAAARIHAYNPRMRLIALLRNPIERAHSQWAMEHERGDDRLPFPLAIRAEPLRRPFERGTRRLAHAYVARGLYARQLERYLALFPREQLLILRSEDLRERHQATLDRVTDFLGVDRLTGVPTETVFAHPRADMRERDRRYLRRIFAEPGRRLEALLGWDLSDWS